LGAHDGASYLLTLKAQLNPLEDSNKVMSTPPLMSSKQINHSILKSTPSPPMNKSDSSIEIITNQFSKMASPSRKKSSPYSSSSIEIIKEPQDLSFKQLSSTTNFQGLYPSGVEYWAPINIQLNRLIQNSTTYSHPRINFEGNSLTPYGLDPNWKISTQFIAPDGNCQFRAVSFWKNATQSFHDWCREEAVKELESYPNRYASWTRLPIQQYIHEMSRLATWGDSTTFQAMANSYGIAIASLNCTQGGGYLEVFDPDPERHPRYYKVPLYFIILYNNHFEIMYHMDHLL